jgi:hypothetical protein
LVYCIVLNTLIIETIEHWTGSASTFTSHIRLNIDEMFSMFYEAEWLVHTVRLLYTLLYITLNTVYATHHFLIFRPQHPDTLTTSSRMDEKLVGPQVNGTLLAIMPLQYSYTCLCFCHFHSWHLCHRYRFILLQSVITLSD